MDKEYLEELGAEPYKLPWWQRLLIRFWPRLFMKIMAKEGGIEHDMSDKLHEVFSHTKRIDIIPLNGARKRGFMMVLDKQTALYFYQDHDHFAYDGYEIGEYDGGDVTIFDRYQASQ